MSLLGGIVVVVVVETAADFCVGPATSTAPGPGGRVVRRTPRLLKKVIVKLLFIRFDFNPDFLYVIRGYDLIFRIICTKKCAK